MRISRTPAFIRARCARQYNRGQLAEIGVMLLMSGVGLHFSIGDLVEVRAIALPGAVLQIGVATLMGVGLAHLWGWSQAMAGSGT